MKYFRPEKVYIETASLDDRLTHEILSRLPGVPRETVDTSEGLIREFNQRPNAVTLGKRYLLLKRQKGVSLKPFPIIPEYLSCHFQILHLGMGCDLDCTYCILQSYLNNPLITVYTNFGEILARLENLLDRRPAHFFRIGTGELIDSLSLDHLTEWSVPLVELFAARKNAVLEFKTKSDNVAHLEEAHPNGRVIVSWSMNTEKIQREEEMKTATLEERLTAAEKCASWGYRIGFHFDPLIEYENCEEDYDRVIQAIFDRVSEKSIAWISLGTLRFIPSLKKIAEARFPRTRLFTGEWIRGLDGKSRYFKPIRKELYTKVRGLIRNRSSRVPIYLCMESRDLWKKGLEIPIATSSRLKRYLDNAAMHGCSSP